VYQNRDIVAGRPGRAIGVTAIQPSLWIASLVRRQEPFTHVHETQPSSAAAFAGPADKCG